MGDVVCPSADFLGRSLETQFLRSQTSYSRESGQNLWNGRCRLAVLFKTQERYALITLGVLDEWGAVAQHQTELYQHQV